ncbi:hypothetical protein [Hyphomicrobium sp.]|uniref:hypothetical protein n=1 Tax=Hyphomicrobium sp. TaxID=82 RepID=UPI0025C034B7|nr:hypothetical protein [Hyphomicrobium sp.]MCC7252052.1 hypothetical protein [Hyphomicrobium sp.]
MQLGTLLSRFEDETVVFDTLTAMDDGPLMARVRAAAARDETDVGVWAYEAVGRFIISADDEQWLGLMSSCSRAPDPGLAALRHMLEAQLSEAPPA